MTKVEMTSDIDVLPNGQLPLAGVPRGSSYDLAELAALVECLLLVAPDPPAIEDLAQAANVEAPQIEAAIAHLQQQTDRGWIIQRHAGRLQLATAPRFAPQIRQFLGLDREAKLSPAALETLAMIAYQQPVTRAELEAMRGVDCSGVLSTLHGRGLIEGSGRRPTIGNPIEYATTAEFLKHFGLTSLADLPALGVIDGQDVAATLSNLAEPQAAPTEEQ
jgi:segregation and condensation protein B